MKVIFYYPSVDCNGKPIVNRDTTMLNHIKDIVTISGGCTVDNQSAGYWQNGKGNLVSETVNRVTIHIDDSTLDALVNVFKSIKDTLNQESVLYELNDKAVFI